MADTIFEIAAGELERRTSLAKLEARGTVRLALRQAGLDPARVTSEQMQVVFDRVLPAELAARGIAEPERICAEIGAALGAAASDGQAPRHDSPEAIFSRLARN